MSGERDAILLAADRAARLAAQTVFDRPVVLEAGAGTGKTSALVARVVCWAMGEGWQRAVTELASRQNTGPDAAGGGRSASTAAEPEHVAARVLDGVIAITFTEAAAAEMASRVAAALAAIASGEVPIGVDADALPGDAGVRPGRAAALLVALDHLGVSTIHAFCRRILAANPLEAGVHPAFEVDADERRSEEIARETVESRLREPASPVEADDLVALASAGIGPDRIARALLALLRAGVPAAALEADPFLPERVGALAESLREAAGALLDLIAGPVADRKKAKNARLIVDSLGDLLAALDHLAEPATVADLKGTLAEAVPPNVLGHIGKWRQGPANNVEREALGEVEGELRRRAGELEDLTAHVERIDEPMLRAACRVLGSMLVEVRRTMRSRGVTAFADLLNGCRDLLLAHPEVAARERRALDQLLVDEFQDTDAVQCEIVGALALDAPPGERPGLFLVGDPKQSIYGWRSADLAAYEAFVGRVLAARGEKHELTVNFRSVPAILAEVAHCIEPVMRYEAGVQPGFQPLVSCEARRHDNGFAEAGRAPVEFWVSEEPAAAGGVPDEPADVTEREARAVAEEIRALHDGHGVAWGDVGLLMRATTDLPVYLQSLRDAGVPHVVERDRSYYRRREIIEASALLRTVLDPTDHIALVGWLRSASVGVPDAALMPLWKTRFPALITDLAGADAGLLREAHEAIDAAAAATPAVEGLERIAGWEHSLKAAVATIARLRASFAGEPAAEVIERLRTATLIEATEAARILGEYRVANLDRFFRTLLAEMDRSGSDPEAVLRVLRRGVSERVEQEEARVRDAAANAVRVMTIHKAKGLDFRHVYLVQAARELPRVGVPETGAEWIGGRWELCLFHLASPGWRAVTARTRRIAEAELVRTLYVAMTRAKDRLVVAGQFGKQDDGGGGQARSYLTLLAERTGGIVDLGAARERAVAAGVDGVDAAGVRWVFPSLRPRVSRRHETVPSDTGAELERVGRDSERLAELSASAYARMARPFSAPASEEAHHALRELLAARDDEDGPAGRSSGDLARDASTIAGTVVHRVLERIDLHRDLRAELASQREQLPRLVGFLAPAGGRPDAIRRADEVLARFDASPLFARLAAIAPHVVARELPILLPPGDSSGGATGVITGAIDLLYRDPANGELVVADYKTDAVETAEEIAARATAYASQGAIYARAVQDALSLPALPRFELWFLWPGVVRAATV